MDFSLLMQEFGTVPILETPTWKYGIPEISRFVLNQKSDNWNEVKIESRLYITGLLGIIY